MAHHNPEIPLDASEHADPTLQLAIEKYQAAWGAGYATEGLKGVVENYYITLFHPEHADNIPNIDAFEGRREAMKAPIAYSEVPDFDTFNATIRDAINRQPDYAAALFEDRSAVENTLRKLSAHGQLNIWTQGDSTHQVHKMRLAGIGDMRRTIATERGVTPREVADVFAGDKFNALETEILPQMHAEGSNDIIIFDDRMRNLERAAAIVDRFNQENGTQISCKLSLVQHGKATALTEEQIERFNPVTNLAELVEQAESQPGGVRILLDYDDTLSDDPVRLQATLTALEETLRESRWLKTTEGSSNTFQ